MEVETPFAKAQTVDPEVRAYVYSLINALGGTSADEDGHYILGDDALACLRDLKRWLKLYDEKLNRLDVARCLAEAKLVTGDILPILASWPEDGKNEKLKARVALTCLELLVPLTWPLETAGEMTVNHHRHTPYLQQAQVLYKAAILSWDTCSVLRQAVRMGLPSIALPKEARTPRDEGIIKLLLYFLRNVAVIRQVPNLPSQGLEMEVDRSATIEAFRDQDVFALLLMISSNMGEDFNLQDVIVLEIIFNLIKGIDVKKLWMTSNQRTHQIMADLKASLAAEEDMHREAKRNAPSRHSRFGTMIWVKRQDNKMSIVSGQDNLIDGSRALFNMDKSKKWSKPQTKQKDTQHTIHDFNRFEDLTEPATEKLRNFVEEFLDSGFNLLFDHLRRAIEREADRLLEVNYRQFFYCVAWFLEAERSRREALKNESTRPSNVANEFEVESYAIVAAVLNQETFIMLNRYMQTSWDNKEWQDLNASMRCFTQILLTVQEMSSSPLDEDQEIAENIQNRIFYEETTHDRITGILRAYKDQGLGYLDACTELGHVFLRVLERYSKENLDLQIRSKRKRRKARKEQAKERGEGDADNDSENEDIIDAVQVTKERKFDFNRFAAKFVSQGSVNSFFALLLHYRDLSTEQLKRIHRFFYRVAFRQDQAVLLYRVDIVALFYRLVKGPEGLNASNTMYKDWSEFTRQFLKKMLKKLETRPELMVEMLFSKINSTLYYLEYGSERQTIAMTRAPAELEVKPAAGRDVKEQIGVVVTVLMKEEKADLVKWIKDVLVKAVNERKKWEDEASKRREAMMLDAQNTDEQLLDFDIGTPSYITIRALSEDIKLAMFKNAKLKLLMKLCSCEILGSEDVLGAKWIIPGTLSSEQLNEFKTAIEEYSATPWTSINPEEEAADLIRRVRNANNKTIDHEYDEESGARRDAFIDDSEGNDDVDEAFLFPDNIRKKASALEKIKAKRSSRKRKRDPGSGSGSELDSDEDEALAKARRKARKLANDERRRKILSGLYVHDSDDQSDEEANKEFFMREEALRKKQADNIARALMLGVEGAKKEGKPGGKTMTKKQKKSRAEGDAGEDDEQYSDVDMDLDVGIGEDGTATASSQPPDHSFDDDQDSPHPDTDTPLSSQSDATSPNTSGKRTLTEISNLRADTHTHDHTLNMKNIDPEDSVGDDNGDDEEDVVATAPRRRMRGGFIVDSDDDDDE